MDVGIIGAGLAGLLTSTQLARKGIRVSVFEKKRFPFHRVCGEYISNETVPFLRSIGVFPDQFSPPVISELQLTSVRGKAAHLPLDQGGFGISRYVFDEYLCKQAQAAGVTILEEAEVERAEFNYDRFTLVAAQKEWQFDVVIGCFGKRSKMDVALKRNFVRRRSPYVGVKYHIKLKHPDHLIGLHNFKDGYCGISNVENGVTNLCYLTHRSNLKAYRNIREMEEEVLFQNPYLRNIFSKATFLFDKPETINEISFETKSPVENHILMAGDAAGMITPLCGNGMALAIHSSKVLSELITQYQNQSISRLQMEQLYADQWRKLFARRLWVGRQVQNLFGTVWASDFAVSLAKRAPPVATWLVKQTHGKPF
jgi:flavin-dependent dehydrogenase